MGVILDAMLQCGSYLLKSFQSPTKFVWTSYDAMGSTPSCLYPLIRNIIYCSNSFTELYKIYKNEDEKKKFIKMMDKSQRKNFVEVATFGGSLRNLRNGKWIN